MKRKIALKCFEAGKVAVLLLMMLFAHHFSASAQKVVHGIVRDDVTGKVLPDVAVSVAGTQIGTLTNDTGYYRLEVGDTVQFLKFSFLGYRAMRQWIPQQQKLMEVRLSEDATLISEVVVHAGRYRNKNNPAVALIKEVIAHKPTNRRTQYAQLRFESYEKLQLGLSNPPASLKEHPLLSKQFRFVFDNLDTTRFSGRAIWPVYLEENVLQHFFTSHPDRRKTIVKGVKKVNYDEQFINIESTKTFVKHLFRDVDIYDNNVFILTNVFLSPIADMAPAFYKFYITDTLISAAGDQWVALRYEPRNVEDKLFTGKLWITMDGNYAVVKALLDVDKKVNINWVSGFSLQQQFEKMDNGKYLLAASEQYAHFGIGNSKDGVFAERKITNRLFDWQTAIQDSLFRNVDVDVAQDAAVLSEDYWAGARPDSLSAAEAQTYRNVDSIGKMPMFKRWQFIISALASDYATLDKYEIGPINSFISFNPVEGLKLRVGGRTRPELNKWLYADGYIAYGFKDARWKYLLSGYWSLNGRSVFTGYPLHYFKVSANRETSIPGLATQFFSENNVLLSIKRGENDKWLYNDIYQADYVVEFGNHHQLNLRYKNWRQSPAANLYFLHEDPVSDTVNTLNNSELSLNWRWAPYEKFAQRKSYRRVVPSKYPIMNVQIGMSIEDFMGGAYRYQFVRADVYKRFHLSQLGMADVRLRGFYLKGQVPFPLLDIARANQTYAFDQNAYNLMNFLEFVSDRNVSLIVDYHLYGFLFNKVPLLKALNLREVVGFKLLYGGLSKENTPALAPGGNLLRFPLDADGQPLTYALGDIPYTEINFGVENILNVLRVDVVRRLNYLQHPNVTKWGLRVGFQFDF